MAQTVALEAFEHSLRGKRSVWILSSNQTIAFPPGFQDQILSEMPNIQRKTLLTASTTPEQWRAMEKWDAILTITNNHDWSVALTFLLYQVSPSLVCIAPELKVPPAFYQRIGQAKQEQRPTLVQFTTLAHPWDRTLLTADAIAFPSISVSSDTEVDALYTIIQQTSVEQAKQTKQVFREMLRDTHSADAAIIISTLGEQLGRASLYWYYATKPTKSVKQEQLLSLLTTVLQRHL